MESCYDKKGSNIAMQISGQCIDKKCSNPAGIIDLKGIQLCHLFRIERAFMYVTARFK
mgnify:CR=1 FL=1